MSKKYLISLLLICCISLYPQQKSTAIEIGFYSECCGTPSDDIVLDYIKSFKSKNKITSIQAVKVSGLGKEGEHSYILKLKELNQKQKMMFIEGLKKVLASNPPKTNSDGGINLIENINENKYQQIKKQLKRIVNF
jgi:hypothetical protein